MEFLKDGKSIILDYINNESYDMFLLRGNFIINNIDKNIDYDELVKLSNIYVYNKYYGCLYNKVLLDKLNKMTN